MRCMTTHSPAGPSVGGTAHEANSYADGAQAPASPLAAFPPARQQGESPISSDDLPSSSGDPWVITSLRTRTTGRDLPEKQGETVTAPAADASGPDLPEYVPVPAIAKGPPLNEHGYHVWQVERNLYAVTDNVYMSAFLTTPDGVVIFDAPPNIGHNIQRAVDEITTASGLTNQVTHMVYSHHPCDHQGASSLFGGDIDRIGHEETQGRLLRGAHRPSRPGGAPAPSPRRGSPPPAGPGRDLLRQLHPGSRRRSGRAGL